jgi:hypothetical protein
VESGRGAGDSSRVVPGYERLIVIDENLSPRLARELRSRGRNAKSAAELNLARVKDPVLLKRLAAWHPGCVLVTGDDSMPLEHGDLIAQYGLTIATLAPVPREFESFEDPWLRETTQRWAHLIQAQSAGSVKRYYTSTHRVWTPPKSRRNR